MRTAVVPQQMRWWHIDEIMSIEADLFGDEQWTPGMFWSELAAGHQYFVVLDEAGAVAGYGGIGLLPPDEAWIQNIAVRRDAQRSGIGRSLMDVLLGRARTARVKAVFLEVAADNEPAQRLYDAYGFATIGVRTGYYQPSNRDALIMRMELS